MGARRTKIVCTIGPATATEAGVAGLVDAGMNVARINFSHGGHETHRQAVALVRRVAAERGANIAVMMDLQGPKIRTGPMRGGQLVDLEAGAAITITTEEVEGTAERISTTYRNFPYDVRPGDRILIADGTIELRATGVCPPEVRCTVVRPGQLGQFKGINLPGVKIAEPSLTDKDRADLAFGLGLGIDYVALSFVRSADDIRTLADAIRAHGGDAGIVAKIERPEALDDLEEIARLSDAVMVARGDLGVEIDFEKVPEVQKRIIRLCNRAGTPVITATQMLESMMQHRRPTRAEAADVANAIYDGTDAVMLSGETAAGLHPLEACAVMARIAEQTDRHAGSAPGGTTAFPRDAGRAESFAGAIGHAVCEMTRSLDVRRIVCFTSSGYTARMIALHRPPAPVVALTTSPGTRRRLALVRGVEAHELEDIGSVDEMVSKSQALLLERGIVRAGDVIVIVAGTPLAVGGRTNLLKLHIVAEEG